MARETKFHFILKSESDKDKPTLLYVRFTLDRTYKLTLQEHVLPKWWNKATQRVDVEEGKQKQKETREAKRVNKFLDYADKQFTDIFKTHREWRKVKAPFFLKPYSLQIVDMIKKVINEYHGKEVEEIKKQNIKPIEFFQQYIDSLSNYIIKRTGARMKEGTKMNYKLVLKRYKKFLEHYKLDDSFSLFDDKFENKMTFFQLSVCNYTPNTVYATNSIMKVWLNHAEEEGLIKDKSFHKWKSKGPNVDHIYLDDEEIRKIYELNFTDEFKTKWKIDVKSSIEQTRDLFIIGCLTGLRISDLNQLNESTWDMKSYTLEIHTKKTGTMVEIPLAEEVIDIYKKYNGHFPSPVYKSAFNRQIQKCARIAGINQTMYITSDKGGHREQIEKKKWELVSSHTARRSFATNLYRKTKDAHLVMNFTGHKTEENFKRYICFSHKEMTEMARPYISTSEITNMYKGQLQLSTEDYNKLIMGKRKLEEEMIKAEESINQINQILKVQEQVSKIKIEKLEKEKDAAWSGMFDKKEEYDNMQKDLDDVAGALDSEWDSI